ncbi:MAG: hypothetical protein ACO3I0_10360 [Limisphaerales bacterium]
MSDPRDTVVQRVRETARRLRVRRGWETAWTGASWGFGALLAVVGTHKVLPLPRELLFLGAALPGLGAGCGFVLGGFRPVAPAVAARWLDARLGLQERLATALEIAPGNPGGDWQHLVIGDAAARCRDVEPRHLIPLRLPHVARWTAALALTLGAMLLVPEYRSPSRLQAQEEAETVRSTGRQLSQLTRRTLEEQRRLSDPIRQELGQLEALGDRLQQASLTRSDALKEVSRASDTLREQGLDLARNPTLRRLEKAARSGSSGTEGPRPGVQESNQDRAAQEAESLQQQLDSLQKAAQKAADGMKSGVGSDPQRSLASTTEQLLRTAQDLGLDLPALGKALEELRNLRVDQFLKDLETASRDLEQLAELARRREGSEADRTGRDLAQQLERGQIDAAIESLERLSRSLQAASPGGSGRPAWADELEKAVPSADGYGAVAQHLQRALEQSNGRNLAEAGKSLSDARKELEALKADLQDLQALRSGMAALSQARQGLSGASAEGGGSGSGGRSRGRGRGGFGDWAEDDPWRLPDEIAESWDNSGQARADKTGRGRSDRETTLPESLTPTRPRGQFQPGKAMPSIMIKGLNLRGESRVGYSEAVEAAQSEAQSALSQEAIPKAYRNTVRDYFDDLKR